MKPFSPCYKRPLIGTGEWLADGGSGNKETDEKGKL